MHKLPVLLKARNAHLWQLTARATKDGEWIPARCLSHWPNPVMAMWQRIRLAVGVFTGKYDAVWWEDYD